MFTKTYEKAREILNNSDIDNPKITEMFINCFEDTLERTIKFLDDGTVFVQTGDIPAMWLRDSTLQLRTYLPFINNDQNLKELIKKVSQRQIKYILHDPYANAFNEEANSNRWDDDIPLQDPLVWERKYEVDSLCFPIQLAYQYWKYTRDVSIFDEAFKDAIRMIISVWRTEQNHDLFSDYTFQRPGRKMLVKDGHGTPVGYTGMTWSGFRPSDDACTYHYLIPSNLLAAHVLERLIEICTEIYNDELLTLNVRHLEKEIRTGIEEFAIVEKDNKQIYAYEVNGFGDVNLMDDSNMPSLLSLPLITNISKEDALYLNTREFVLSKENPYYYEGKYLHGVGSPHTPPNQVWHIAVAVEGITSLDQAEKLRKIEMISETDGGTNFAHESIDVNDPTNFTREWFSWANAMFCELVLDYCGLSVQYK